MKLPGQLVHEYSGFLESKKNLKNPVQLKELNEFGIFFKNVIHSFLAYFGQKQSFLQRDKTFTQMIHTTWLGGTWVPS